MVISGSAHFHGICFGLLESHLYHLKPGLYEYSRGGRRPIALRMIILLTFGCSSSGLMTKTKEVLRDEE